MRADAGSTTGRWQRVAVSLAVTVLVGATAVPAGAQELPAADDTAPPAPPAVVVEIRDDGLHPARAEVPVGGEVIWRNAGTGAAAVVADDGTFDSHPACRTPVFDDCLLPGGGHRHGFEADGTHRYEVLFDDAGGGEHGREPLAGVVVVGDGRPDCPAGGGSAAPGNGGGASPDPAAGEGSPDANGRGADEPGPGGGDDRGAPPGDMPCEPTGGPPDGGTPPAAPDPPEAPTPDGTGGPTPDRPGPGRPPGAGTPPTSAAPTDPGRGGPGSRPDSGSSAPAPNRPVEPARPAAGAPRPAPAPPVSPSRPPRTATPATGSPAGLVPAPSPDGGAALPTSTSSARGGFPAHLQALMDSVVRTPANSTSRLMEAVEVLEGRGVSRSDAVALVFGRFPVGGQATYSHDWWFPRVGPGWRLHQGTDIFAERGTPVRAPAAGVVSVANRGLGGLSVRVTEPDGTYWYLAHLSSVAAGLVAGTSVEEGEVVGAVGDSGNAKGTPPHLHLEWHPGGGGPVDPKETLDRFLAEAEAAIDATLALTPAELASAGSRPSARPLTSFRLAAAAATSDAWPPRLFAADPVTRSFVLASHDGWRREARPGGSDPTLFVAVAALAAAFVHRRRSWPERTPVRAAVVSGR